MKILLVGGTGVLSSEIMKLSIAEGHEVFVINRGNHKELIPENVHLLRADINDHDHVKKLMTGLYFDVVVEFLCSNAKQVENSVLRFKDVCDHYIFISSCAVYKIDGRAVYAEGAPVLNPLWEYSAGKVDCEKSVCFLCKQYGMKYTIVRPAVTYGNTRIPYGIMPPYGYHWTLVARILNDKPVLLWNHGLNATNITRVEDFAKGFVALYGQERACGEAFNINGDECSRWIDVINVLGELLGKSPVLANVTTEFLADEMPERRGEILGGRGVNLKADNAKIKSIENGFGTTISLKEGLAKTLAYYRENHYLNGIDYAFDANIDRIIHKYYKKHAPDKLKNFNLVYMDYMDSGLRRDRMVYLVNRYSSPFLLKWAKKSLRLFGRTYKKVQKVFCSRQQTLRT